MHFNTSPTCRLGNHDFPEVSKLSWNKGEKFSWGGQAMRNQQPLPHLDFNNHKCPWAVINQKQSMISHFSALRLLILNLPLCYYNTIQASLHLSWCIIIYLLICLSFQLHGELFKESKLVPYWIIHSILHLCHSWECEVGQLNPFELAPDNFI